MVKDDEATAAAARLNSNSGGDGDDDAEYKYFIPMPYVPHSKLVIPRDTSGHEDDEEEDRKVPTGGRGCGVVSTVAMNEIILRREEPEKEGRTPIEC